MSGNKRRISVEPGDPDLFRDTFRTHLEQQTTGRRNRTGRRKKGRESISFKGSGATYSSRNH